MVDALVSQYRGGLGSEWNGRRGRQRDAEPIKEQHHLASAQGEEEAIL